MRDFRRISQLIYKANAGHHCTFGVPPHNAAHVVSVWLIRARLYSPGSDQFDLGHVWRVIGVPC
jgi:hypothetical protein